jgi:hypothetical protein
LLDIHRKKAFGYTKMGMLSGRTITNNIELGQANTKLDAVYGITPWGRVNLFFTQEI